MAEERVWPTRWTPWSLLVSALGYAVAMDKDADSYEVWCAKRDALAREVAEMLEQHYTQASRAAPREPGEAAILAVVRELAGYGDTCFDWDTPPDGSYGNTEEDRRALWEDAAELLRRAYAVDFGAARPDAGEPGGGVPGLRLRYAGD